MRLRALLVLALALATVPVLLASDTKSDTNMKKNLTLGTAAQVGTATLQPGDYKVEWQGTGQNVNVKFIQGNKVVATAPATVESKESRNNSIQLTTAGGNGAATVREIDWAHVALVFQPGAENTNPPSSSK
jgi:hypothetical protein